MYTIIFKLNHDILAEKYTDISLVGAYAAVDAILVLRGFTQHVQGVYFGDIKKVNAVSCVLASIELTKKLPWFSTTVSEIRMLRIESTEDLMPAVTRPITNAVTSST